MEYYWEKLFAKKKNLQLLTPDILQKTGEKLALHLPDDLTSEVNSDENHPFWQEKIRQYKRDYVAGVTYSTILDDWVLALVYEYRGNSGTLSARDCALKLYSLHLLPTLITTVLSKRMRWRVLAIFSQVLSEHQYMNASLDIDRYIGGGITERTIADIRRRASQGLKK